MPLCGGANRLPCGKHLFVADYTIISKVMQANDRAVMAAYNFPVKISEAECVAKLFEMYQALTES